MSPEARSCTLLYWTQPDPSPAFDSGRQLYVIVFAIQASGRPDPVAKRLFLFGSNYLEQSA
jgi:hypothetical protein